MSNRITALFCFLIVSVLVFSPLLIQSAPFRTRKRNHSIEEIVRIYYKPCYYLYISIYMHNSFILFLFIYKKKQKRKKKKLL
ncbi:hypothetical protein F4703DRAFT_1866067, partial [Phycomyces blakesleeanus]